MESRMSNAQAGTRVTLIVGGVVVTGVFTTAANFAHATHLPADASCFHLEQTVIAGEQVGWFQCLDVAIQGIAILNSPASSARGAFSED